MGRVLGKGIAAAAFLLLSAGLAFASLAITADSNPGITRTCSWLTLMSGDMTEYIPYVQVKATFHVIANVTYADAGEVSGTIGVVNPDAGPVTVQAVTDEFAGAGFADVVCGASLPAVLDQNGALECAYSITLPNASARDFTVSVQTAGGTEQSSGTVSFDGAGISYIDGTATVSDSLSGYLGVASCTQGMTVFKNSSRMIYCNNATEDKILNDTGFIVPVDTQVVLENTVGIGIACRGPPPSYGCTRNVAWWKNHGTPCKKSGGVHGGWPSGGYGIQCACRTQDNITALLPVWLGTQNKAKSVKVTTAKQALDLLGMKTSGCCVSNGIAKLYSELLAAKLNIKSGADPSAISDAIAAADALLATKKCSDYSRLSSQQKAQITAWVKALNDYNEGRTGPGKCAD